MCIPTICLSHAVHTHTSKRAFTKIYCFKVTYFTSFPSFFPWAAKIQNFEHVEISTKLEFSPMATSTLPLSGSCCALNLLFFNANPKMHVTHSGMHSNHIFYYVVGLFDGKTAR